MRAYELLQEMLMARTLLESLSMGSEKFLSSLKPSVLQDCCDLYNTQLQAGKLQSKSGEVWWSGFSNAFYESLNAHTPFIQVSSPIDLEVESLF